MLGGLAESKKACIPLLVRIQMDSCVVPLGTWSVLLPLVVFLSTRSSRRASGCRAYAALAVVAAG